MSRKTRRSRINRINRQTLSGIESLECRALLTATPIGADAPEIDAQAVVARAVPRIVNGTQTSDYEAVGMVNGQCTGTLISPTHVLTAAHCVESFGGGFIGNSDGSFEVGGQTYGTSKIVVHSQYNPQEFDAGHDLAIMELNRTVSGIDPMDILRQAPQVGQILTLVGFGEGGTSTGGFDPNDEGKQVGRTELEGVTANHITWNFDSHSEANTAPGDSGGPAFVTVGGKQLIAGVTSGGTGEAHELGDSSFDTRVDVHADWIDSIVSGTNTDPGTGPGGGGGGGGIDDPFDPGDIGGFPGDDGFGFSAEDAARDELNQFDSDGDGQLSLQELTNEFVQFGESQSDAAVFARELISMFDVDGSGKLSLAELVVSYGGDFGFGDDSDFDPIDPAPDPIDPDLTDDFDVFSAEAAAAEELELYDIDGNGELSRGELAAELRDFGETQQDANAIANDWIESYDTDNSGGLSFTELVDSYGTDFADDDAGFDFPESPEFDDFVPGDINGDSVFDSSDLIGIFASGHFEDGIDNNSTLADGDLNGDGDVDTADLIYAFQHAVYVDSPAADDDFGGDNSGDWNNDFEDDFGFDEDFQDVGFWDDDVLDDGFWGDDFFDDGKFEEDDEFDFWGDESDWWG